MIDVNFDFTMDTDGYWDGFWTETGDFATDRKDPDWYSATLKEYHRVLWSRELPNRQIMKLNKEGKRIYLQWNGINFGSDSIITSFRYDKGLMGGLKKVIPDFKKYMEIFIHKSYTIGGEIIFPMRRNSINQMRGINPIIKDRFDLTLECIRRYYNRENSPLSKTLEKDKAFFDLFIDFTGYVNFFFLNDLVTEDYNKVNCWCGKMDFKGSGLPKTLEEYIRFIEFEMDFLEKRNCRIKEFCGNER